MEKEKIKELEDELKQKEEDFAVLYNAFGKVGQKLKLVEQSLGLFQTNLETDVILNKMIELLDDAIGVEAASLLLLEKEYLFFKVTTGPKQEEIKHFKLKLGEGIAGYSALHKEIIAVSDVRKDPRFMKEMDEALGFATKSLLSVPVVFKQEVKGVIELVNKEKDDTFTSDDVALVKLMALLVGLITNIRR